jgi:hypothetical protein
MLQMHMQAAATQGGHGMAWQVPAVQPLQAPAAVWGMPVGSLHPAMQPQQQPVLVAGTLDPQFPASPAVASRQASAAVRHSGDTGAACQPAPGESVPAEDSSIGTGGAAAQSLSPFAAAAAGAADSTAGGQAGSWLAGCLRLSRRRTSAADTTAVQPRQGSTALAGGTSVTAAHATLPSTVMQLALLPFTVARMVACAGCF